LERSPPVEYSHFLNVYLISLTFVSCRYKPTVVNLIPLQKSQYLTVKKHFYMHFFTCSTHRKIFKIKFI